MALAGLDQGAEGPSWHPCSRASSPHPDHPSCDTCTGQWACYWSVTVRTFCSQFHLGHSLLATPAWCFGEPQPLPDVAVPVEKGHSPLERPGTVTPGVEGL